MEYFPTAMAVACFFAFQCLGCVGEAASSDAGRPQADAARERDAGPLMGADSGSAEKKHIIIFIGDGMPLVTEIAASRYLFGEDRALSFHSFEYSAYVTTFSVTSYNIIADALELPRYDSDDFNPLIGYDNTTAGDAPYPLVSTEAAEEYLLVCPFTDSGAAMTAIMTGQKTDNGNISYAPGDPPEGAIETIAEKLRAELGYAVGMVSSMPFNHATPACVMAHNVDRNNLCEERKREGYEGTPLAEEIVRRSKPDVVISGGHPRYASGFVTEQLYQELKSSKEYIFVERQEGASGTALLADAANRALQQQSKLWGLFGDEIASFGLQLPADSPGSPSCEVNPENPRLADAVQGGLAVLAADPDGFFLMVEQSDVDRANVANAYNYMIGAMNDLNEAVATAVRFVERPDDDIDWTNTLLIVTSDHACGHLRFNDDVILGKGDLPKQVQQEDSATIDYPDREIVFGKTNHSNGLVMIYARGDGVELIEQYEGAFHPGTRIIDNTHIYQAIHELTGVQ